MKTNLCKLAIWSAQVLINPVFKKSIEFKFIPKEIHYSSAFQESEVDNNIQNITPLQS